MEAKRFPDRDQVAAVRAEAEGLEPGEEAPGERRLAGRVLARRELGKLTFLDLVDRSGRIQILCPVNRTGEIDVHLGDIVGVTGHPTKSRRGEPSLIADELEVLAHIRTPLPDTFHGLTDVEQRYRRRYVDLLMNEETRRDFMLRARMVTSIRRFLDEEGFVEVETPVLQPRYGGAFARPFSTHSQRARSDALPADRHRALPQAADRRGARARLRARQGLPQRGRVVQAQPRVHDARVVRGLRRLPRHDGPHGAARHQGRPGNPGADDRRLPRPRDRPGALAAREADGRPGRRGALDARRGGAARPPAPARRRHDARPHVGAARPTTPSRTSSSRT